MGVWCDADRNQCIEKTGAIRTLNDDVAQRIY